MNGGGGQRFGPLVGDVGAPGVATGGGHGGGNEQAPPFGMAAFGQSSTALMLSGLIGSRIEPDIGDQGVGVTEGETLEQGGEQGRHQRPDAANSLPPRYPMRRRGIAVGS